MNKQDKHTEGKWSVNELSFNTHQIQINTRSNGALSMPMYAGQTQDELNQDARFIVKCCNNHERLVEALKAIVDHFRMNDENNFNSDWCTDTLCLLSELEKDTSTESVQGGE